MKKLCLLSFCLLLSACSHLPSNNTDSLTACQYTQRDLTVDWADRLYWCEAQ